MTPEAYEKLVIAADIYDQKPATFAAQAVMDKVHLLEAQRTNKILADTFPQMLELMKAELIDDNPEEEDPE